MEKQQLVREQSWREKRNSIAKEVAAREEIDWKLENRARAELEEATIAAANAVARRDGEQREDDRGGRGDGSVGIRASGFFPRSRTLSGAAVSSRSSGSRHRPGTSGGIGLGLGGMGSRSRTSAPRPSTSSSGMRRKKVKVALHSPAPFTTVDFIARSR